MADFTKTAINQNAKREYISPIPSIDAFNEVVNAFKNDTSMGFTKKELTATTFKTKIVYFNAAGDEKAYGRVTSQSRMFCEFIRLNSFSQILVLERPQATPKRLREQLAVRREARSDSSLEQAQRAGDSAVFTK